MAKVLELGRSVELRRSVDEGTVVEVTVAIDVNGDLVVSGHDIGTAPNELLHSKSYDHWVIVGEEDKDLVLLHLLRERFADVQAPTAELMEWLKENQIPHEVGSSAGEHRGRPRAGVGRRRHRRTKRTQAGP